MAISHSPGFRAATLKLRCGVWEKKLSVVLWLGGEAAGEARNRLPIPEVMTPGCMPTNGVSNERMPRIRWRLRAVAASRRSTTSAARIPPIEWPSSTMSVVGHSNGDNLRTRGTES